MKITLKEKDLSKIEQLSALFDQLPPSASAQHCSLCGGAIVNYVCASCNQPFQKMHVKWAMNNFLIGIVVLAIGVILIAYSGERTRNSEGFNLMKLLFSISIGFVGAGIAYLTNGIFSLLFKKKNMLGD